MALTLRVAAIAVFGLSSAAAAQPGAFPDSSRYAFSLNFGRANYQLASAGESGLFAVRLERPMAKFAIAEAGIAYARPQNRSGDRKNLWIPELQVQAQLPRQTFAPYIGVGGGIVWDPNADNAGTPQLERATNPTVSVSVGVRTWFGRDFGARAEVRTRALGGEFSGGSVEWMIGGTVRLGP